MFCSCNMFWSLAILKQPNPIASNCKSSILANLHFYTSGSLNKFRRCRRPPYCIRWGGWPRPPGPLAPTGYITLQISRPCKILNLYENGSEENRIVKKRIPKFSISRPTRYTPRTHRHAPAHITSESLLLLLFQNHSLLARLPLPPSFLVPPT